MPNFVTKKSGHQKINDRFSDMRLGPDGHPLDEMSLRYKIHELMDENCVPIPMKMEKNEAPLLHKNFYNGKFIFASTFNLFRLHRLRAAVLSSEVRSLVVIHWMYGYSSVI
jgi:hypothetical protein